MKNEKELIREAEDSIEKSDLSTALEILTEILEEINPQSLDALNDLAVVHILRKDYEKALVSLDKIISIDPQNETAVNNLLYINSLLESSSQTEIHKTVFEDKVSVIIPVFNKKELTLNCLNSLNRMNTPVEFEVIVVDNASEDGSAEAVAEVKENLKYELKYIRNNENLGFAKANNIGVRAAKYSNLLFLNNDTLITEDFLSKPLSYLSDSKVGIVGIKLLYPDNLVQHAGIVFNKLKRPDHIFKFYKNEHPMVNRVYEVQAVTGACLFIQKEIYGRLGGFEEKYLNGWEDIDLCFKVKNAGLKVLYTGETFVYHLESQSEGRLNFAKDNERLFMSVWSDQVISDEPKFYEELNLINSADSFHNKFDLKEKINFAIKIGVPSRNEKSWGDIYYAASLQKALIKKGHTCVVHYLNEWDQSDRQIEVVIHIKGLSSYKLKPHNINIIWVINHPELHTVEELDQYDLVLCASKKYYEGIKDKLSAECYFMPQATDEEIFNDSKLTSEKEIDLLFIGNNYEFRNNKCRKIIADILQSSGKYNLQIIGNHWQGFVDNKYIKAEFADWNELPSLYGKAKIVLNDHQESMRENGFVNNRTYDLALMGAFQITNYVEGLEELGIVFYKDGDDLIKNIDFYLADSSEREKTAALNKENCKGFTFTERAEEIIGLIKQTAGRRSLYTSCNICGHKGDDFLPMGSRQKVRCPICGSLERQRALWFLFNRDNMIKPGMKILEIAPLNNVVFRKYFEDAGCEYICIDKWKHGNPLDRRDTSWIDYEMDVCDLRFPDDTFDLVFMQHVIEEVPDDMKAFSEIGRVTKPDGFAVLEVPHDKNRRKTIEYKEPQKFGNLRQYGVDFYEKIKVVFRYREEIVIDGIQFSKLGKTEIPKEINLPVLLDHPSSGKKNFAERFSGALSHLNGKGFIPLTTAQANNLVNGNVHYAHPYWVTLDDGTISDIELAYPLLKKLKTPATSFLIPDRLNEELINKWKDISGSPYLDIQNHSADHRQCFVSGKLIGIYRGEHKYSNLMENVTSCGFPIFEYESCLKRKRFVIDEEVINECLQFYKTNDNLSDEDYIKKLQEHLTIKFNGTLGEYETDDEFTRRIEEEINGAHKKLTDLFGKDIYAFSFPWGLYCDESLKKSMERHTMAVRVNPQRINHNNSPFELDRVDINGSAFSYLISALYTTEPWEKPEYKDRPKVAVLMTTFNRHEFLADAIQSVIDQTFKDWNLIIVNDGGEDVKDLIGQFNDPRIIYFNRRHEGKAASLNFALKNSKSFYIAYLDDDDRYCPNHLEVLVSYAETHKGTEFVYSVSREAEMVNDGHQWKAVNHLIRYARQATSLMLRFANHIPNLCALHTRSLIEKAGMYDETLDVLIDWDMYRRMALIAPPVFIGVVTSEYTKRTYTTAQEKQITGLFFRDPVKYYNNRVRILSKKYPAVKELVNNNKCVILICNEKNYRSLKYFIYKIDNLRKIDKFDVVFACDMKLNETLVEYIMTAEGKSVMTIASAEIGKTDELIDSIIENNAWEKIAVIDDPNHFNTALIKDGFAGKERVNNYSSRANKLYPAKKMPSIRENDLPDVFVSVIIPTFNNWRFTKECLDSIFTQNSSTVKYEVIIVDNFSTDETRKKLEGYSRKYKNLKVVLNEKNEGFAKGNNIGATHSEGNYLLFLNNDTVVRGNWLDNLVLTCLNDKSAGIVGGKLCYPDGTIQHAGVLITKHEERLIAYHPFTGEAGNSVHVNSYRYFQAVTGACLLITKELFNSVNGFDERFINGYEDVDLCFKISAKGFKVKYCPEVEIIHHESKSAGRFDNVLRNEKLLNEKWTGKIEADEPKQIFTPKVSIVVPVHDQLDYTKKCLDSIRKYTTVPYEIIVVNDRSSDGTDEFLKSRKDIIVRENKSAAGYPASCNAGIQASSGEYVVLLNNDTLVTPRWIEGLLEVAESDTRIGLVGPVSNSISGFQMDHEAGYSDNSNLLKYSDKIRFERRYSWMQTPRIAFVCALIKREVIDKIGGLDERFSPGNFEDDDFCLRAQIAGYKTIIANDVFIHHFGSKSFRAKGEDKYKERLRINREIFVDKWGADPEEIWIKGKQIKQKRNISFSINSNLLKMYYERAKSGIENDEFDIAVNDLKNALSVYDSCDSAESIVSKEELLNFAGNISLIKGELEDAKKFFETMLGINNTSPDACLGLGQVFYYAELFDQSKTMLEWAFVYDPENASIKRALGEVNLKLGQPEEHNSLLIKS